MQLSIWNEDGGSVYDDIFVSVVTCVYNTAEEYLVEAVKSILAQTHQNFEYLLVDDCSDKDLFTADIFQDPRIRTIRLTTNHGPAEARNIAFDVARGKYIAIMDSDDISLPERLKRQVAYLEEHPDVVACGTWFTQFGQKSNEVKRYIDDNEYYRCCLLFGNSPTLLNPSVLLRRNTLLEHQIRYDVRLRKGEDYKMWVQLSQIGKCTNIHENLFRYRVHQNQTSQKLRTKQISPFDWIVMKEQFEQMGMTLTEQEEELLRKDYRSNAVDPYQYRMLLEKILQANRESAFFAQEKLEIRVQEQWKSKVLNIKNIKTLLSLLCKADSRTRKEIWRIEWNRVIHR